MTSVPTVFLLGEDHLALIPEYLHLGTVVVVAPDRELLSRWQREGEDDDARDDAVVRSEGNLVVDLTARRVTIDGRAISLSDLEFRVLSALLARPGRAWSFLDLRRAGWGEGPDLIGDDQVVRALVQRLRRKLRGAGAHVTIEAVRSFGYRAEVGTAPDRRSLTGVAMPPRTSLAATQAS